MALTLRVLFKALLFSQDRWLRSGSGLTIRDHTTPLVESLQSQSRPTAENLSAG
jgi:hypothetical protein